MISLISIAMAGEPTTGMLAWADPRKVPTLELHLALTDATEQPATITADSVQVWVGEDAAKVTQVQRFGETGRGAHVAILVDRSGYTPAQQEALQKAVSTYVAGMNPKDDAAIFGVGKDMAGPMGFSSKKEELEAQVKAIAWEKEGETHLWDACLQGVGTLAQLEGRKALVILSDGEDSGSTKTQAECREMANKAGIPIFTAWYHNNAPPELRARLRELALLTQGLYKEEPKDEELAPMIAQVRLRLDQQWVVTVETASHAAATLPVRIKTGGVDLTHDLPFPNAYTRDEGLSGKATALLGGGALLSAVGLGLLLTGKKTAPAPAPTPTPTPAPAASEPAEPIAGKTQFEAHRSAWRLVAEDGPLAGQSWDLGQGLRVGAAKGPGPDGLPNAVVIADPPLSSFHFEILLADGAPVLVDRGSTNGTWMGERKLSREPLAAGARFRAGNTTFRVDAA